jgi:hypothetical protein
VKRCACSLAAVGVTRAGSSFEGEGTDWPITQRSLASRRALRAPATTSGGGPPAGCRGGGQLESAAAAARARLELGLRPEQVGWAVAPAPAVPGIRRPVLHLSAAGLGDAGPQL